MTWSPDDILDAAARSLREAAAGLDAEQAVRGLDALEELDLHAILAAGLAREAPLGAPWGVLREQHYPGDRTPSRAAGDAQGPTGDDRPRLDPLDASEGGALPGGLAPPLPPLARESDRQRCDIVLTPKPGRTIADPVRRAKATRAKRREAAGTLFEAQAERATDEELVAGGGTVPPGDAFWLEVKLVGQYCFEAGVPGPNRTYGSQLVRGAAMDLAKLAKDPHIEHAAVLIVLFTETAAVAEHDLIQTMHRCLDRGVAASTPITVSFPITERIGNGACTVALIRARRG